MAVPTVLSIFAAWIAPVFYNGVVSRCQIGMFIWCFAEAIGHSARHKVLDEHERMLANADPGVR